MYTILTYTGVRLELLHFSPPVCRVLGLGLAVWWDRLIDGGSNGPVVAVASWTAEISRQIDTDKSRTLRLPRRRLSVEETEAAAAAAARSRNWRQVPPR